MGTLSSIGSSSVAAAALFAQIANAVEPTTEEVVVTGIRVSVGKSIDDKRDLDVVADVVTAEDVGKFPDHNVAEALQRVTGVQITRDANEGKFVNVRGLPSEFNHVTLNGQAVTSASDNQIVQGADRNFDFSLLATDFISSLRVYKTPRADLEEGALAATIDIQTLRPFELDGRRIVLSAQAQEYDIKGEQEPNIAALYSDLRFDRRVGLIVGAAWNRRSFQGQGMDTAQLDPVSLTGEQALILNVNSANFNDQLRDTKTYYGGFQLKPTDSIVASVIALHATFEGNSLSGGFAVRPVLSFDPASFDYEVNSDGVLARAVGDDIYIGAGNFHQWDDARQRNHMLKIEWSAKPWKLVNRLVRGEQLAQGRGSFDHAQDQWHRQQFAAVVGGGRSAVRARIAGDVLNDAFGKLLPLVPLIAFVTGCAAAVPARTVHKYSVLRVSANASGGDYRSLDLALAAAARLRRENGNVPLKIEVATGDYYVDMPLRLGADLSGTPTAPTVIAAAANNKPRLLAGRLLQLTWKPYRDGIFQARLNDFSSGKLIFDQLFVNGERQVRARYPNYDARNPILNGYAPDALSPERVGKWRDPVGGIVHALHGNGWGGMHIPILGKKSDGTIELGAAVGNNRPSGPHATYRYVENVFEELDSHAEWYYDASDSTLYYMPPADVDMTRATFATSGPARIFDVQGTLQAPLRFVRIEGFELQRTASSFLQATEPLLRSDWMIAREGAIYIENAEDVTVAGNTLSLLGGNGVFVSGYGRRITIGSNHIHDIGGGGISFTGRPSAVRSPSFQYAHFVQFDDLDLTPGPKTGEYPAESVARDNLIHDIGIVEKQVAGVQISMAMNISVAHNTIYRTPRAGINIGDGTWGGHVIEFNDVFDTVLETGDNGAFNSWGRDRFWHPDRAVMDQLNRRHPDLWKLDAIQPITLRNNRFRCAHGWDIDLDDGASNYRVYNNVLLSGGMKFREGFDRAAWNNVIVNNGFHPHAWFVASGDRFERNIVMEAHQPVLMNYRGAVIDFNLFSSSSALDQARSLGLDRHSRYGDAQFENPARGDFRVRPDSPAKALGFENFPMSGFGVTSEWLKRLAAP